MSSLNIINVPYHVNNRGYLVQGIKIILFSISQNIKLFKVRLLKHKSSLNK